MSLPELPDDMNFRVRPLFEAGFYDAAVAAAYKMVEVLLRTEVGPPSGTAAKVIVEAWSTEKGKLHHPSDPPSTRSARLKLFQGAFETFRNQVAHHFVDMPSEDAVAAITLAGNLYSVAASAICSRRDAMNTARGGGALMDRDYARHPQYRSGISVPYHLLEDITGDGVPDFVIVCANNSLGTVVVIDGSSGQSILVNIPEHNVPMLDTAFAVDIDHDGVHELFLGGSWDFDQGMIALKYREGLLHPLQHRYPSGEHSIDAFVMAYVADYDYDGRPEIVEEPWMAVPEELLPEDESAHDYGWGRVRSVWKWNAKFQAFELIQHELARMGPRF